MKNWDKDIEELECFFRDFSYPVNSVILNESTAITDIKKFVANHLSVVKANKGKQNYLPYLERLIELKTILTDD